MSSICCCHIEVYSFGTVTTLNKESFKIVVSIDTFSLTCTSKKYPKNLNLKFKHYDFVPYTTGTGAGAFASSIHTQLPPIHVDVTDRLEGWSMTKSASDS